MLNSSFAEVLNAQSDNIYPISTLIPMEPHPSLDGLCFELVRGLYPRRRIELLKSKPIGQFRYTKIQPKTIDLSTRLRGINTEFVGFIPQSLVLRSIVLG